MPAAAATAGCGPSPRTCRRSPNRCSICWSPQIACEHNQRRRSGRCPSATRTDARPSMTSWRRSPGHPRAAATTPSTRPASASTAWWPAGRPGPRRGPGRPAGRRRRRLPAAGRRTGPDPPHACLCRAYRAGASPRRASPRPAARTLHAVADAAAPRPRGPGTRWLRQPQPVPRPPPIPTRAGRVDPHPPKDRTVTGCPPRRSCRRSSGVLGCAISRYASCSAPTCSAPTATPRPPSPWHRRTPRGRTTWDCIYCPALRRCHPASLQHRSS